METKILDVKKISRTFELDGILLAQAFGEYTKDKAFSMYYTIINPEACKEHKKELQAQIQEFKKDVQADIDYPII